MSSAGKHIERFVRRSFIRSLGLLPRRSGRVVDLANLRAPRILLLRHDRIGDAIISTPAIGLLRERFPESRIDILLGTKNAAVAPLLAGIDNEILLPRANEGVGAVIGRLRGARYDIAINLLAKDSASGALLAALSGAAVRIGFDGSVARAYDVAVPKPAEAMHIVRETTLLLAPLGIEPIGEHPARPVERLHVAIPAADRAAAAECFNALTLQASFPIVIFNISGSGPEKYWGRERFIELATCVRSRGLTPVIASAPADSAECIAIASASEAMALPATTSFAAFAAMLEHAAMIVTPDTSVVHLAAALGKPTVMLVGSAATGGAWGPWGVPTRILAGDGSVSGIAAPNLLRSIISLAIEARLANLPSSAS